MSREESKAHSYYCPDKLESRYQGKVLLSISIDQPDQTGPEFANILAAVQSQLQPPQTLVLFLPWKIKAHHMKARENYLDEVSAEKSARQLLENWRKKNEAYLKQINILTDEEIINSQAYQDTLTKIDDFLKLEENKKVASEIKTLAKGYVQNQLKISKPRPNQRTPSEEKSPSHYEVALKEMQRYAIEQAALVITLSQQYNYGYEFYPGKTRARSLMTLFKQFGNRDNMRFLSVLPKKKSAFLPTRPVTEHRLFRPNLFSSDNMLVFSVSMLTILFSLGAIEEATSFKAPTNIKILLATFVGFGIGIAVGCRHRDNAPLLLGPSSP